MSTVYSGTQIPTHQRRRREDSSVFLAVIRRENNGSVTFCILYQGIMAQGGGGKSAERGDWGEVVELLVVGLLRGGKAVTLERETPISTTPVLSFVEGVFDDIALLHHRLVYSHRSLQHTLMGSRRIERQ